MAPLTENVAPAAPAWPNPGLTESKPIPEPPSSSFADLWAPQPPADADSVPSPTEIMPLPPTVQASAPFVPAPAVPVASATGPAPLVFALERRSRPPRSGTGPVDWIAFVLAFLAPPVGLLLGVVAVIIDSRSKGYAAGIAKAAIGIGVALSIVLGVAVVVVTKIDTDQAAHAAIVSSSSAWCTKLKSNPMTLSSDTLGWPSPAATIPASIPAMQGYETYWEGLAKVAPAGIRGDTQKVANTAKSIVAGVQSTQTLNDAGNVAQLQNVVAGSGIHGWVSNYCN
jgi:hypothetical protein